MGRIVWDQAKCTGCRVCEGICSFTNEKEFNPAKSRCKILRTLEDQVLYKVRVFCLQCEKPYCKAVCPAGAISETDDGVKVVDEEKCLGCKMCEIACPVGAITVNPDKGTSLKCDLCKDQDMPQCVDHCFAGALQYIPGERAGNLLVRSKAEKFMEIHSEGNATAGNSYQKWKKPNREGFIGMDKKKLLETR